MMQSLPPELYEVIDPAIVRLCRVLNSKFPGIRTIGSCQGYIDGHRPDEPWVVSFGLDRRARYLPRAVNSLEWLAWAINSDLARSPKGHGVVLHMSSPPPSLNKEPLYFSLLGVENQSSHPDVVVDALELYFATVGGPA